jgi:predicted metal-binding membrane protein
MRSILVGGDSQVSATLRQFFWQHPEWWSVGFSGFAWMAMLVHCWQHAGHSVHHWMNFRQELVSWVLMVAAMMLPFVLDSVRAVAVGSFWARRHRAVAGFLVGYLTPWLALGVLAAGMREVSWTHTYTAPALGFTVAVLWQMTSMHRRALVACHRRRPLAPLGWQADRDCFRFGGTIGVACVSSCWPLMLACLLSGHGLIAMAVGMAIGAAERWPFRPRRRMVLAGTLALAGYYAALAGFDSGFFNG